ncbi:MAG TPA: hypothetical protein PLI19_00220 [Erysipelotrichaceae bacterium]|jgi:hypothetical protein|nr:hypothetical protein [Erysipelotrichaceae bacterium]HQB31731.1 hypothetical protein [Erysipelotrichaceae bacterium]
MENIIYNELIRRGFSVQVGIVEVYCKDSNNKTQRFFLEIYFVASLGSRYYYIKSAYRMDKEEKKDRNKEH